MKRFLFILLCLTLFLCMLVACGNNGDSTENSSNKSEQSVSSADKDGYEDGSTTDNSSNSGASTDSSGTNSSIGSSTTDSSGGGDEKPDIGGDFTPDMDNVKYQYDMSEYVILPSYRGHKVEISRDELQNSIDSYILSTAVASKKTICMTGDVVYVTYFGYKLDEDGEILYENGKPVIFDEGDSGVYLGARLFLEEFEKGIAGMKIGDIKEVYVTFPEDYFEEELAGERVIFEIILNSIYEPPVYNDDFVKKFFTEYDSTASFENALKNEYALSELWAYIDENTVILSYPEKEYNAIATELEELEKEFLENYSKELDEYIEETYGMTRDEYIKSNMKAEMIYYAIAQAEGIVPTDDELKAERNSLIEHYIDYYTEQGVDYREAVLKAQEFVDALGTGYVYDNVIYEKIDEKLTGLASVTETPATYKSVTQYISEREGAKTGNEIGDLCPSFEAEVFDENGSLGTALDPTRNFGKLTVINFWGTWCGPCKSELPDFDRVAADFGNQVTIFAVHSSNNYKEASEYVLENFPDSSIIFMKDYAKDPSDPYSTDALYDLLGGTSYYPYTVILDENGIIRGAHVGMMTYAELVNILTNLGLEK